MFRSIRWRLPLSYAGIALLTAACLGAVLMLTLRGYYVRREDQYLAGNAAAISVSIGSTLAQDPSFDDVAAQLRSIAFLSQTRVRLFDASGAVVVDSGEQGTPDVVYFSRVGSAPGAGGVKESVPVGTPMVSNDGGLTTIIVAKADSVRAVPGPGVSAQHSVAAIPAVGTSYGFWFGSSASAAAEGRSDRTVTMPVYAPADQLFGVVQLSEGPAYGQQILEQVATGWALASVVAVLAAALAGWLISRHMSAPLLTLTDSTARMAAGDLSARVEVRRRDEFGDLATAFNHMAGRVEGTVTALRRFVADAAHELHTPLTALRTDLELLAAAPGDEDTRSLIAGAQEQAERLQALTSGLMDLSRLEGGPRSDGVTTVDFAPLVSASCERHAARAEQGGIAFRVEVASGPLPVPCRAADLERILDSLVDNAIKFSSEGGEVSVTLRQDGGHCELAVSDRGIGIPADELPLLFSRFHRARNASGYPGNGLGLAIVRAIVDDAGGQAGATSAEGVTRFTVRLPLAGPLT